VGRDRLPWPVGTDLPRRVVADREDKIERRSIGCYESSQLLLRNASAGTFMRLRSSRAIGLTSPLG
jgi:hypothetical protein